MLDLSLLSVGPADGPAAEGVMRPGANGIAGVDALDVIDAFAALVDALAPVMPGQTTVPPAAMAAGVDDPAPVVFAPAPVLVPLVFVPPQGSVPTPQPAAVQSGLAPDWADLPAPHVKVDADDDDRSSTPATLVVVEIMMPALTPLPVEAPVFNPALDAPVAEEVPEPTMEAPVARSMEAPVFRPALDTPVVEAPADAPVMRPALGAPRVDAPDAEPAQDAPGVKSPRARAQEPAAAPITPARTLPDLPSAPAKPIAAMLAATIASLKLHALKALKVSDATDPIDTVDRFDPADLVDPVNAKDTDDALALDLMPLRPLRQPSAARTTAPEPVTISDPLPAIAAWQFEPVMARVRSAVAPEPARIIVTRGAASVDLLTATAALAPSTTARATVFEVMPSAATAAGTASAIQTAELPSHESVARLVQSIRLQWARGGGEAQIRLEPRHFGEVTVSVRVDRESVSVRLEAAAPAVREWLQTQQQVLRTGLAEHRLTLARLEVTEPSRQEPFDSREGRQSHPRERRESRRGRPSDPNATFDLEA